MGLNGNENLQVTVIILIIQLFKVMGLCNQFWEEPGLQHVWDSIGSTNR